MVVALGVLTGCGYHFAGTGRSFAPDIRTIGIETFVNETREHGVEKRLALAIEREFTIRGPLRVASVPAEGDLVLSGRVHTAMDRPVAFNREDEVLIYETTVILDLELRRRATGELVWQVQNMRGVEDYESVPSVVVTTSSDFRSSTLNAEDLGGLTDIQLAESRRRRSLDRIVANLAADVYNQIMEDF
jgi:Lipopolysaccharide-assembly